MARQENIARFLNEFLYIKLESESFCFGNVQCGMSNNFIAFHSLHSQRIALCLILLLQPYRHELNHWGQSLFFTVLLLALLKTPFSPAHKVESFEGRIEGVFFIKETPLQENISVLLQKYSVDQKLNITHENNGIWCDCIILNYLIDVIA